MAFFASLTLMTLIAAAGTVHAHSGPPFPIASDRVAGAYSLSVWTDPDTTDDGSAGGQFWVVIAAASGDRVPPGTVVTVAIMPLDRVGDTRSATARPDARDPSQHFAALVMDHEGRFDVRVTVEGPLGTATITAETEATYDVRPPPAMLALYVSPFLVVGALWLKLLIGRRRAAGQA